MMGRSWYFTSLFPSCSPPAGFKYKQAYGRLWVEKLLEGLFGVGKRPGEKELSTSCPRHFPSLITLFVYDVQFSLQGVITELC